MLQEEPVSEEAVAAQQEAGVEQVADEGMQEEGGGTRSHQPTAPEERGVLDSGAVDQRPKDEWWKLREEQRGPGLCL